ncbi:hypothetical protein IH879_15825, partial [candidate division KSB1 bacterium]|nr:hypothetical protein [candidate division KSB1 bacterium]
MAERVRDGHRQILWRIYLVKVAARTKALPYPKVEEIIEPELAIADFESHRCAGGIPGHTQSISIMRIVVTCRDGLITKALFHKSAHANTAIRLVQRVNPHIGGSVLRIVDREVDPALGLVTIQHRRAYSADGRGNDIAGEHL